MSRKKKIVIWVSVVSAVALTVGGVVWYWVATNLKWDDPRPRVVRMYGGRNYCKLANCYYYGYGVNEDKVEAYKWYCMAAKRGDFEAQRALERYYYVPPSSYNATLDPVLCSCRECGALVSSSADYCTQCGSKKVEIKRCENCNSRMIEPNDRFCPHCGHELKAKRSW